MTQGTVQAFDAERGFGYIRSDSVEAVLFVHCSEIRGPESLEVGQRVEFDIAESRRGPQACRVVIA